MPKVFILISAECRQKSSIKRRAQENVKNKLREVYCSL